jgi:hypothetical protein
MKYCSAAKPDRSEQMNANQFTKMCIESKLVNGTTLTRGEQHERNKPPTPQCTPASTHTFKPDLLLCSLSATPSHSLPLPLLHSTPLILLHSLSFHSHAAICDIIWYRARAEVEALPSWKRKGNEFITPKMLYPQFLFALM